MSEVLVDCRNCRAPCCRAPLRVFLSYAERKSGRYDFEFINPEYGLSALRQVDGRCVHLAEDSTCKVWEDRPQVCREYTCATDERVTELMKYGDDDEP